MTRLETTLRDRNWENDSILLLTSSRKVCRPLGLIMLLMVAASSKLISRCGVSLAGRFMVCEAEGEVTAI